MPDLKETAIKAINSLPDDVDLDDLLQEIIYHAKIDAGLQDIREGLTVPIDEVAAQFGVKE